MVKGRTDWAPILDRAVAIVESYDTSVTLRQLYYRLVSEELIPNLRSAYGQLSARTAKARREGWFPALIDPGRDIDRWYPTFTTLVEAQAWIKRTYRRDRTEGQEYAVYLGVEKAGMVEQLRAWFGSPLGIPVVALGGYSSQSYVAQVMADVERDGRPAVLIYAGDLDSSGEDIDRDFIKRTGCWNDVVRVALTPEQVRDFALPPLAGKTYTAEHRAVMLGKAKVGDPSDSRSGAFIARHGEYFQVEVDALPPEELRQVFADELARWWDEDVHAETMQREIQDREDLP